MLKKLELMYRPPGSDEYKDITQVLDQILLRLESIEYDLKLLKDKENL
jgi:hypothetical protein